MPLPAPVGRFADLPIAEVATPEGSLLVPYEIRRNRRARYIRLTLGSEGQARLSVPWYCAQAEAVTFLRTQGVWLQKQLAKAPARVSLHKYLTAHPMVYALGYSLGVTIGRTSGRSYYLYSLRPAQLLFQLAGTGAAATAEAELLAQIRAFAREVIPLRVQQLAQERGVRYTRTSVRDQASRWGSCSTSGTISLNWRLVLLRPQLQDHVILHELAHRQEMNHSERFWNLLRRYDPHCDAHDAQLNVVSGKIMSLGRS